MSEFRNRNGYVWEYRTGMCWTPFQRGPRQRMVYSAIVYRRGRTNRD